MVSFIDLILMEVLGILGVILLVVVVSIYIRYRSKKEQK
jgi:hypothetical protein